MELLDYIRAQSKSFVLSMLQDQDACRTYIRLLPPLSQHILFRLLYIPRGYPVKELISWGRNTGTNRGMSLQAAYSELKNSYLIDAFQDPKYDNFYVKIEDTVRNVLLGKAAPHQEVKPKFRENPFNQISGSSIFQSLQEENAADEPYRKKIDQEVLDNWAISRLESILNYMLGIEDDIDVEIKNILATSKLIDFEGKLNPDGHKFLLLSSKEQIWRIVKSHLEHEKDLSSSLRFLLKLGSMQLTEGYPLSTLTSVQRDLVKPFSAIGLLFEENGFFYPTKSVLYFFGKSNIFTQPGWLLMDTNFKITAYPTSRLQSELLKKFAIVSYEMPGFVSAFISPNSFRAALDSGTTLDDILAFLEANLSRSLGSGEIPSVVRQQFYVWRDQRDRITVTPKCVQRQFATRALAEAAAGIADSLGGLVFGPHQREREMFLVITTDAIEAEFEKQLKMYIDPI